MENIQSEMKPTKIRKRHGTTYCLRCKEFTHNFRPQEVKMINKVLREKSNCVVLLTKQVKIFKTKTQQPKIIQRFTD